MILGHPSNTSMPGLVIGLTVFGASAVAARGLVFGSLHKSLAKRIMVDPATGFQKRINSLPDFLASLVPAVCLYNRNLPFHDNLIFHPQTCPLHHLDKSCLMVTLRCSISSSRIRECSNKRSP